MKDSFNDPGELTENEKVLATMKFYDDNKSYIDELKQGLKGLNLQGLEGTNFVNLEGVMGNDRRSQFPGVATAQGILLQESQAKLLLYAFSQAEYIQKKKPELALLLANSNVRFDRLPLEPAAVVALLRGTSENEKGPSSNLDEIAAKELAKNVGRILHRLRQPNGPENDPSSYEADNLASTLEQGREYFPALVGRSDAEALELLLTARRAVPEKMKGENIAGVYCDIEGTLLVNGKLNEQVLQQLKSYEAQGKAVTLWTDGDAAEIQQFLQANAITYPLKSKVDFAGATAEIVIDNDDQNSFFAKTRIVSKQFIRV